MEVMFELAKAGLWEDVWSEIHSDTPLVCQNEMVHKQDPRTGKTLLHIAVEQNLDDIVEDLVVVWKINVHVRDHSGRTALDLARRLKEKDPSRGYFLDEMIALMQEAGLRQPAY